MCNVKKIMIFIVVLAAATAAGLAFVCYAGGSASAAADQREQAHGMNYVCDPVTGASFLIWSDEYRSGSTKNGNWTHDVFYQPIDPDHPQITAKKTLVRAEEAQEPASASFAADGSLMVTFEDGNDPHSYTLAQRYGIYKSEKDKAAAPAAALAAVVKYDPEKTVIGWGGHSGHCSSTKTRHVVFWNEGWVDGGGVGGLGSGDDVWVTSMKTDGTGVMKHKVAVGSRTRDWWPVTASSSDRSLLVWQRYVKKHKYSHICFAVYDPVKNRIIKKRLLKYKARYYSFNAVYLKDIDRYAVNIALNNGKGVLLLVSDSGRIVSKRTVTPGFTRETAPAVCTGKTKYAVLCYPALSRKIMYFRISKKHISRPYRCSSHGYKWPYRGTSGFFNTGMTKVTFASLGSRAVILKSYSVPKSVVK